MSDEEIIAAALEEDIPDGDLTTGSLGTDNHFGTAYLIAKQDLHLSGREMFEKTVTQVDEGLKCQWKFEDGSAILDQQIACHIQGNLIKLLQAERVALNFLGHLSGIASKTQQFVKACEGTSCKILDTRKTLPLYRHLEKKAVRDGGGTNHRMNLSDAILIKENHLFVGEGLEKTIETIRQKTNKPIEVEVKNLDEVQQAVALKVQRVMLDNMSLEEMQKAREIIPREIEVEASGNMTLPRIPSVAKLGVDYISVGALTHSAPVADFSLIFNW